MENPVSRVLVLADDRTQFPAGPVLKSLEFVVARRPWTMLELESGDLALQDLDGKPRTDLNLKSLMVKLNCVVGLGFQLQVNFVLQFSDTCMFIHSFINSFTHVIFFIQSYSCSAYF